MDLVRGWIGISISPPDFLFSRALAANQQVDAIHVTQLERDTVLVCLDSKYRLNPQGDTVRPQGSSYLTKTVKVGKRRSLMIPPTPMLIVISIFESNDIQTNIIELIYIYIKIIYFFKYICILFFHYMFYRKKNLADKKCLDDFDP